VALLLIRKSITEIHVSDDKQTSPEVEPIDDIQEPEAAEAQTVDAIQEEIAGLNLKLVEAQEQSLRALADAQNARRRADQDVEKAHKFGQEKLVTDLLPVIDNLERAIDTIDANDEQFKPVLEGIELTLKSFQDTLTRNSVVAVNPEGEPFDPQLHQAMTMVPSPDVEPNSVINVFQKGYTLHGRLIRPAMVVVSKTPE
jgi:molecular chaperone GrpE